MFVGDVFFSLVYVSCLFVKYQRVVITYSDVWTSILCHWLTFLFLSVLHWFYYLSLEYVLNTKIVIPPVLCISLSFPCLSRVLFHMIIWLVFSISAKNVVENLFGFTLHLCLEGWSFFTILILLMNQYRILFIF